MAEKSGIDKVCTSENFVRGNYFSNTYRADLKVGEELGSWDVVHISLPFSPLKEKELQVRFNLDDDALQDFYKTFGRSVKNCILVSTLLKEIKRQSSTTSWMARTHSYLCRQEVENLYVINYHLC